MKTPQVLEVELRRDLYEMLDGDHCQAMILGMIIARSDPSDRDKWQRMPVAEVQQDLMFTFGETAVRRALTMLVSGGYLITTLSSARFFRLTEKGWKCLL